MRHCQRWPPPEALELMRIAPEKVPKDTGRSEMMALLKSTAWQPGAEFGLAGQVLEALGHAAIVDGAPGDQCPVLDISETSYRFLRHYSTCQSFGHGMGGMMPPAETLHDSNVRDVHAFNLIHHESERLRKLDKKDPSEDQ